MTVALPCLCIAGPTASGKTAAALAIAAALAPTRRVEIISVDSALVYRGMNIGTAKPTPQERAQVPHHLIDLIDPSAAYSAAQFVAAATKLIDDIAARGALPLLVGGTMLYFKALFDGLDDMPAADLQIRAEIDAQAARDGWPALHAELARIDPLTAQRLAPADAQRVQRALEVFRISGKPLSAFHSAGEARASAPLIALEPADRAWLHARIGERFVAMLAAGFIDEVRALRARGDLHADLPAMRCVGYRQAWQALDRSASGEFGEPQDTPAWRELRDAGTAATRQLAKRQLTWLRSMPGRHSVACDAPDALARTVELAHELIAQLPRT